MSSPDFSQLSRLQVSGQTTATYRLSQLEGEPTLTVAPATEANAAYFDALLRQSKAALRAIQASGMSKAAVDQRRADAKRIFATTVVRGWAGVLDARGALVPFSPEACAAFLNALPDWIFDQVRSFCSDPSNFVQPGEASPAEVAEAAGN